MSLFYKSLMYRQISNSSQLGVRGLNKARTSLGVPILVIMHLGMGSFSKHRCPPRSVPSGGICCHLADVCLVRGRVRVAEACQLYSVVCQLFELYLVATYPTRACCCAG